MAKASAKGLPKGPAKAACELSDLVRFLHYVARGKPVPDAMLALMRTHGLVGCSENELVLTGKGRSLLSARVVSAPLDTANAAPVHVPDVLERLAHPRKGEAALLAKHDSAAGQKFQEDLERAGLRQQITQSWSYASLVLKTTKGSAGPQRNEPVAMLDARTRVQAACVAMGPELSGLLIDICLYDKSLAIVERERGWPARSGKLAVALGLKALARHYGLDQIAQGARPRGERPPD